MQATSPNYYDDADSAPAPSGGDESEGKTAMLNKSVCGGKECAPGDTITLRIVKDHGDELEVECTGSESEESEPEPQAAPDEGMGSMME